MARTPINPDRKDYPGWTMVVGKFRWQRKLGNFPLEVRQIPSGYYRVNVCGIAQGWVFANFGAAECFACDVVIHWARDLLDCRCGE